MDLIVTDFGAFASEYTPVINRAEALRLDLVSVMEESNYTMSAFLYRGGMNVAGPSRIRYSISSVRFTDGGLLLSQEEWEGFRTGLGAVLDSMGITYEIED